MLKASNVSVKYSSADERCALSDVSFSINENEKVALIGANGAGKSTLLMSLCGVIRINSGFIEASKIKLEKNTLNELRKRIGVVFQNPDDQLFMPTVYEDIAFGPRNYGIDENLIDEKINITLESLGVSHLANRMSHKLSGGEKRLAALAGVIVMEPDILLMDEPTSFLDPLARRTLINVLKRLAQTMLIATHDLDMALDICDRAILLKNGKVYADMAAHDLLYDSKLLMECGLEPPLSISHLSVHQSKNKS